MPFTFSARPFAPAVLLSEANALKSHFPRVRFVLFAPADLRDEPHEQDRNREREHRTVLNASSKTVHLRGLSQRTSESMIWALLERFAPQCVRLGPDREQDGAGNSLDGFASAFVDFQTADAAAACVAAFSARAPEGHSASPEIDSRNVSVCIAERPPTRTRKQDWLCSRCKEINFARRSVCFSCKVPRDETCTLIGAGTDIIGPPAAPNTPSTLVLVSGLASDTTEVAVGEALSAMAKVPVQEVRLARCRVSNAPRGWALLLSCPQWMLSMQFARWLSSPVERWPLTVCQ